MKYFEKRKLIKYREHLKNPTVPYPQCYIDDHKTEIECLDWLISYYNGKTASTPLEYLESLLDKYKSVNYRDLTQSNCVVH